MSFSFTRSTLTLLAMLALLSAGCAAERKPINRVQANALDKSFFVGELGDPSDDPEFYWRNFVVDASETQSMIGIGSWSGVDRIRWEITENTLFARRAYPQNPGADNKGNPDDFPNSTIVAAYPIESHFDIIRDYNPSTGEELNIIEENESDRPWQERQYMRVDWSINLVDTPQWYDMFAGKVFGAVKVTPLAYYVSDANNPDAPHFVPDEGYFDVTSKFWVEPDQALLGDQLVPMCLIMGLYTGNAIDGCDPQEAVVRSSYWKVEEVDRDGDFEPFENTAATLDIVGNPGGLADSQAVGIVTPPRVEWDPQYQYTDANFHRLMHVHNIWQQSHQTRGTCSADSDCRGGKCLPSGTCSISCSYDARGDRDGNGTDDQCENADTGYEGAQGSQCSYINRCTIPYRDRIVKPVGWWMNAETPEALTDPVDEDGQPTARGATEDLVYTWNQAMKQSVAKAREVECRDAGGSRKSCHEEFFVPGKTEMVSFGGWGIEKVRDNQEDVLFVCHNPVRSYDNEACGPVGDSARVGDLRRNFLFYWPYASRAPWGGIADWNADPLTGQIVGAAATTMGRSATYAAAMVRDIIMVANGELSISEIADGYPATIYEKELTDGRLPQDVSGVNYEKDLRNGRRPKTYTKEQIDRMVSEIDATNALETIGNHLDPPDRDTPFTLDPTVQAKTELGVNFAQPAANSLEFEALADKVRGSQAEAQLTDASWAVAAEGLPANAQLSDDLLEMASPLRGGDNFNYNQLRQLMELRFQARGICFTDPAAANIGNQDIQGVAEYFRQKFSNAKLEDTYPDLKGHDDRLSRKRAELIYDQLWKESYKGIALHEMGHGLGMLHQFTSSYDSTNYNPQYWQLRTHDGKSMASCDGVPRGDQTDDVYDSDKDSCMGPRYLDPETDDELGRKVVGSGANARIEEPRPGITYFGNTSTMEYQNERFFESVGLGQFDVHTMNVLYGRVVQTFDSDDNTGMDAQEQLPFLARLWSQLVDDNLIIDFDQLSIRPVHYTEAAREMKLFDEGRCRDATDAEKAKAEWRIVHGQVCSPPPKDYARWDDFTNDATYPDGEYVGLPAPRAQVVRGNSAVGNLRWPYRWGVGTNAYPHANSTDAGADIYELTMETIRKFDYSYIFNYFRRGRRDWFYGSIPSRTSGAFFERLRGYHWSIASMNAFLRSLGKEAFSQRANDDDDWRPYLMAEQEMFKAIAGALLMPQIGTYYKAENFEQVDATRHLYDPDGEVYDPDTGALAIPEPGGFALDTSTGRYIDPAFYSGPERGGSWDYQSWIGWMGFGSEKVDAIRTLVDGRSVFFYVSRANYLDGRNLNVNFRSDMGRAVDRLLGGLMASDWESIAPFVDRGYNWPEVQLMDFNAEDPSRPPSSDAHLLFPNVSYRQQLGGLIWGHLFSRLNTDLSLSNKLRIFVDGFQSQVNIPEDQQIRFYDPRSGFTYIARRFGNEEVDGKIVDKGIASRMLQRANLLLTKAYEVEVDDNGDPLYDDFGMPVLVVDDDGFAVQKEEYEELALNRLSNYVGLIDMAVQINDLIGYGPIPD